MINVETHRPDHQFAVFGIQAMAVTEILRINRAQLGVSAAAPLWRYRERGRQCRAAKVDQIR